MLAARVGTSSVPRIDAGETHGNVGDPWTPIKKTGESLSVSATGWSYKLLSDLLLTHQDMIPPPTQHQLACDGPDTVFVAEALVRGQGKTEGWHRRVLPMPERVRRLMSSADGRNSLAQRATDRIEQVRRLQSEALWPALRTLIQADTKSPNAKDHRPGRWIEQHQRDVDRVFFDRLWADVELNDDDSDRSWQFLIVELGKRCMNTAIRSVPIPGVRWFAVIAASEREFEFLARRACPLAFEQRSPIEEVHP